MYMYFINNETFSIVVLECQLFYYCYMFGNDTHVHMMCSPQFKNTVSFTLFGKLLDRF